MLHVDQERIVHVEILRKSIDARQRRVVIQLKVGVHLDRVEQKERVFVPQYRDVSSAGTVVVVGAGPAGLFAALRLIELGKRPIVLERGKCVEERKQDLNRLYKTGVANEDSNYGFGEEMCIRDRLPRSGIPVISTSRSSLPCYSLSSGADEPSTNRQLPSKFRNYP